MIVCFPYIYGFYLLSDLRECKGPWKAFVVVPAEGSELRGRE